MTSGGTAMASESEKSESLRSAIEPAALGVYMVGFGRWEKSFAHTLSWPVTWSLMALFFTYCAYKLILY
jgi:hypothetical protein